MGGGGGPGVEAPPRPLVTPSADEVVDGSAGTVPAGPALEMRFALRPRILTLLAARRSKSLVCFSGVIWAARGSESGSGSGSGAGASSGWVKSSSVPIWSAQEQLKIWFW